MGKISIEGKVVRGGRAGILRVQTVSFRPPVDICESVDKYEIFVELPGIDIKGVDVTFRDRILTIYGEKTQEINEKVVRYHAMECDFGKFERRIFITAPIDIEKTVAEYHLGVLSLTLYKRKERRGRAFRVPIKHVSKEDK